MAVALFRFEVLAPVFNEAPDRVASRIEVQAAKVWDIPGSKRTRVAKGTIYDWLRLYRQWGFDGLLPKMRCDRAKPRRMPPDVVDAVLSIKHPCLKSSPNRADSQLTGVCVQQVLDKYSTAYPHDGIADLGAFGAHLRPSRSSTFAKIMSFRMMATMATLCRLPLAINRSYSAAMSWFHR